MAAVLKKTICFVGFDDRDRSALQAATASSNPLWECHFAADAAAARLLLAQRPCDALVANMSMPGQTGAELLREARQSFPKTLVFVVGEVSDQALIISCVGGTHQFVRRPFQPAKLVAGLKRGLSLDAWLATDELHQLMPRLRRLPSLPSTYFNLLKEIESDSATTQSIGAVIAREPVATARLLQMANSASLSLAQKVADPVDAVTAMGLETVKSLVMGLQVFGQGDAAREAGFSLEVLWEHSLLVAKFSRQITLKQTGDARLASDAFTAGLLHDVGRIVMASNLPKEYAAIIAKARECSRPLHEEEIVGLRISHAEIGAYLLGLWGLPVEIVEATAGHHAPGHTAFAAEFSLLAAVHAANVFAHESGGQTDALCLPRMDLEYLKAIRLDGQVSGWRECCTGETPPPTVEPSERRPPAAVAPRHLAPPVAAPADYFACGLVAAALLLLAGIGVVAWRLHARSTLPLANHVMPAETNLATQPLPMAVTAVPPAPTAAETNIQAPPASPPPAASPFDGIRIQGIFYRAAAPLAIINGQTVGLGDRIQGLQVAAIDQHSVTLQAAGERRVFSLNLK